MIALEKIGLIVNPLAGRGQAYNLEAARRCLRALQPGEVIGLPAASPEGLTRARTIAQARELAGMSLDAVVVVGGDGTLADVACVFTQAGSSAPILGIGAGSTNAGVLVTCPAAEVDRLAPENLEIFSPAGLLAYDGAELLGVGFNDCVVGRTVVATLDGRLRDVGVVDKFAGRNIPARPAPLGRRGSRVWKEGPRGRQEIARGAAVGTVILGLAERAFVAKAVTGGVCLAAFSGLPAGCLVADQPLVQVELTAEALQGLTPIHSTFTCLDEDERVYVRGAGAGSALCVDGTPLKLLRPRDEVSLGVRLNAVRAIRLMKK